MIGNLLALLVLFTMAWFSHWLNETTQLMFPSALIGMLILFFMLLALKRVPKPVEGVSRLMLKHMSLFFIPITLSVLALNSQLFDYIGVVLVTIVVSTAMSLLVSACVYSKLALDTSNDD